MAWKFPVHLRWEHPPAHSIFTWHFGQLFIVALINNSDLASSSYAHHHQIQLCYNSFLEIFALEGLMIHQQTLGACDFLAIVAIHLGCWSSVVLSMAAPRMLTKGLHMVWIHFFKLRVTSPRLENLLSEGGISITELTSWRYRPILASQWGLLVAAKNIVAHQTFWERGK
jgi:hypothetical protein